MKKRYSTESATASFLLTNSFESFLCALQKCVPSRDSQRELPICIFFILSLLVFSVCSRVPFVSHYLSLRFLFSLSHIQYLFSSGIFNRCQLASDTYCCFQQTQTFFLRLTFLKWLFAVVQYIAKIFFSQQILCIRNGFEVSTVL